MNRIETLSLRKKGDLPKSVTEPLSRGIVDGTVFSWLETRGWDREALAELGREREARMQKLAEQAFHRLDLPLLKELPSHLLHPLLAETQAKKNDYRQILQIIDSEGLQLKADQKLLKEELYKGSFTEHLYEALKANGWTQEELDGLKGSSSTDEDEWVDAEVSQYCFQEDFVWFESNRAIRRFVETITEEALEKRCLPILAVLPLYFLRKKIPEILVLKKQCEQIIKTIRSVERLSVFERSLNGFLLPDLVNLAADYEGTKENLTEVKSEIAPIPEGLY